jgi:hypothetical protein
MDKQDILLLYEQSVLEQLHSSDIIYVKNSSQIPLTFGKRTMYSNVEGKTSSQGGG